MWLYSGDVLCLGSARRSRGLGLWWDNIDVEVLSYSQHHFHVAILGQDAKPKWYAAGIYSQPDC